MLIQLNGIAAVNGRGQVLLMEIEIVPQVKDWSNLQEKLKDYKIEPQPQPGIYKVMICYGPEGGYLDIDLRTQLCELRDSELWSGEVKL